MEDAVSTRDLKANGLSQDLRAVHSDWRELWERGLEGCIRRAGQLSKGDKSQVMKLCSYVKEFGQPEKQGRANEVF